MFLLNIITLLYIIRVAIVIIELLLEFVVIIIVEHAFQ